MKKIKDDIKLLRRLLWDDCTVIGRILLSVGWIILPPLIIVTALWMKLCFKTEVEK